jgi:PPIC-type PPIASE domain
MLADDEIALYDALATAVQVSELAALRSIEHTSIAGWARCYTSPALVRRVSLLLLVTLLVPACHRKPSVPPDVVARVSERTITLSDFKRYLERNTGTDLAQMGPEVASAMLDQYVEEVVLSEYAGSHGVEVPAEKIASAVRSDPGATVIEKRDEMRRQKIISDLGGELTPASDDEIRAYYQGHPAEFRSGEEVHVRQILIHDEALATGIEQKLKGGARFEDLSAQYSLAPNAKKGGEIGYVSRGELPKMFEDEIFALKAGGVSGVIRTDASFHIFKVDERRPPGTIDLNTAAPVIRERLKDERAREQLTETIAKAKAETSIAVLTRRLPFKYSGMLPKNEND